jgi:hypothetical protein
MRLALEIPTAHLPRLTPHTDLDFALAHRVLEDPEYAFFYAERPRGRELILDNSMHELGTPLPVNRLYEAARRVRADYVIAPDKLGDPLWTLDQLQRTSYAMGAHFKIGVVMCGRNPTERGEFLRKSIGAAMLCLPYREDRLSWFREQKPAWWNRIHLLGASSLTELSAWTREVEAHGKMNFSVDTSKPIKAAFVGRRLDDGGSLRGIPISSKALLGMRGTEAELELMVQNINILRKVLGHGSDDDSPAA